MQAGSLWHFDVEMLDFELSDLQFSDYLKYNNTETAKCCWYDTGSGTYAL
jgi:hypothetical protein